MNQAVEVQKEMDKVVRPTIKKKVQAVNQAAEVAGVTQPPVPSSRVTGIWNPEDATTATRNALARMLERNQAIHDRLMRYQETGVLEAEEVEVEATQEDAQAAVWEEEEEL